MNMTLFFDLHNGSEEMAPLFSLMVSFEAGATEKLDVDAAVVRHDVLQWVCRMRPGFKIFKRRSQR